MGNVLIFLMLCVTCIVIMYMCICAERGLKIFADTKYEERISKLEQKLKDWEKK